ncbi:MAG: hypothetical protein HN488_12005 [Saprospiraceae bacterium]|nr:hypothetical protein [Saprospiraceae bacterium]MDA9182244.1 hypothetical protein [Saprospiraceae bacterium]
MTRRKRRGVRSSLQFTVLRSPYISLQLSILEEYVNGEKFYKVVQHVSKSNVKSLYNQYQSEGKECFIRPASVKS